VLRCFTISHQLNLHRAHTKEGQKQTLAERKLIAQSTKNRVDGNQRGGGAYPHVASRWSGGPFSGSWPAPKGNLDGRWGGLDVLEGLYMGGATRGALCMMSALGQLADLLQPFLWWQGCLHFYEQESHFCKSVHCSVTHRQKISYRGYISNPMGGHYPFSPSPVGRRSGRWVACWQRARCSSSCQTLYVISEPRGGKKYRSSRVRIQ